MGAKDGSCTLDTTDNIVQNRQFQPFSMDSLTEHGKYKEDRGIAFVWPRSSRNLLNADRSLIRSLNLI
jgi:hypothetical protein